MQLHPQQLFLWQLFANFYKDFSQQLNKGVVSRHWLVMGNKISSDATLAQQQIVVCNVSRRTIFGKHLKMEYLQCTRVNWKVTKQSRKKKTMF